jgi:polar amino acid transport system substrate-binding protein
VALLFSTAQGLSAGPRIPDFWDARERLAKPDLSTLKRLRFLTTVDFPPFNFLDAQGRLAGFHVDLARAICRELQVLDRCEIQALPWGDLKGALAGKEGEAILAGIAITPETRKNYAFSSVYLQFPARFVMPKAAMRGEPLYRALAGLKIGVIAGSAHERMLRDDFPAVKAVPYTDEARLRSDLRQGRIAGIFGDGMKLGFWLGGADAAGCCAFAGGPYLAPSYLGQGLAAAVSPDDPQLVAAINYALHEIGVKGTFAELYLRYFPVSFY